jgi:hypothetical protein
METLVLRCCCIILLTISKALVSVHMNTQHSRFRRVVNQTCGLVFLGTPHAGLTDEGTLLHHNQILESCTNTTMKQHTPAATVELARLALDFEKIAKVPILSVHEAGVHKRSSFFRKNKVECWQPIKIRVITLTTTGPGLRRACYDVGRRRSGSRRRARSYRAL